MEYISSHNTKVNNILAMSVLALLLFACLVFSFYGNTNIAYADENTFSMVFPTTDYLQTTKPTLLSGNQEYLAVYDEEQSSLFVLGNTSQNTDVIHLDIESVQKMFLLDDVVLFVKDYAIYTLDLSQENPTISAVDSIQINEESYLTSDGYHLYIHAPSGLLSVYDSSLSTVYGADNSQTKLYSQIVIAGEDDDIYAFTSLYGVTMLTSLNISSNQTSTQKIDSVVYSAYVGDVIYAIAKDNLSNESRLVCLSKQDGSLLFSTDMNPQSYFASGSTLYTIENDSVCIYTINNEHTALDKLTSITMTGSDEKHLNTPKDLSISNGSIVVADTLNNRLSTISSNGTSTLLLEDRPLKVYAGASKYVAFENKLIRLDTDNQIDKTYDIENLLDVVYLDKLYILTSNGVYTLIGDNLLPLASIENAKRITSAIDGKNIYVLTNSEIVSITPQGKILPTSIIGDFSQAVDIAVDYEGKVFVAYKNQIKTYIRDEKQIINVENDTLSATITSICLDGNKLYFTASESFVGIMSVDAQTKDTYQGRQIDINSCSQYEFMLPKENALYYSIDDRCDNTSFADSATLLVLNDVDCEDGYAYALNSNAIVKIALSEVETIQTTTLSGNYVTIDKCTLYSLPYRNSDIVEVNEGEHVTLISDVANYDSNIWVLVEYDSKTYFAKKALLEEYIEIIPDKEEEKKIYGKANADRVGGMVCIYSAQDIESEVIYEIVDGSKVEVLEEFEGFYLVSIDEYVGYIQKDQLKIEGLTTVQIVAIILSIIVALAGIAIFASISLTKKNNDEKEKSERFTR